MLDGRSATSQVDTPPPVYMAMSGIVSLKSQRLNTSTCLLPGKDSKFSYEQVIGILRRSEAGANTGDLCRQHGISAATFVGGAVSMATAE